MTATPPATGDMIACDNLVRIYSVADVEVVALQGLDLRIRTGEMVAIVGASGSGKSTLLNILGGLDVPTAGRALVDGQDLAHLSRRERTRYRRTTVGMVWQQTSRNLLPDLDVTSNVALPMVLDHRSNRDQRAEELLELVGLSERARHRPGELSGGEQQRVAIAVALANAPSVLLADEPTGELDSATSADIFELLRRVNREIGTTIVAVTHDPLVADHVSRTVRIRDGRTSTETVRRTERSATGDDHVIAEEFAVLDRAGRLQLCLARRSTSSAWPTGSGSGSRTTMSRSGPARRSGDDLRRPGSSASSPGSAGPVAVAATGPGVLASAVQAIGVSCDYPSGDTTIHALAGVDLRVEPGELIAVRGRSGSGKTTLLNVLGGLDRPTDGTVAIEARSWPARRRPTCSTCAGSTISFVFQGFGLLPILSAAENVEYSLRLARAAPAHRRARVARMLELVGLEARAGWLSKHRAGDCKFYG